MLALHPTRHARPKRRVSTSVRVKDDGLQATPVPLRNVPAFAALEQRYGAVKIPASSAGMTKERVVSGVKKACARIE